MNKSGGTLIDDASDAVEYEAKPPMFQNHPIYFVISVALCGVGIGLIVLLVWWFNTRGTRLTVTRQKTILRKGVFSKFISEVNHVDVKNVQIEQGIIQRMFNVGTIRISSSGQGDFEILASGMPDPNRVRSIIDLNRFPARQ